MAFNLLIKYKLESDFHKNLTEFHQISPKYLQNLTDICQQLMACMVEGLIYYCCVTQISYFLMAHTVQ